MPEYTVAVREKGKTGPWTFVAEDLSLRDTTHGCRPLSRDDAMLAKTLFIEGAKKAGRPIDCRIVRLCKGEGRA